jgi:citrate synthase
MNGLAGPLHGLANQEVSVDILDFVFMVRNAHVSEVETN